MREYERWDSLIQYWAERFGVPYGIAKRQMMAESFGDPNAKSNAGAVGLFQLMPGTAWELKVKDRRNPDESTRAGLEYLARMRTAVLMTLGGTDRASPEDVWRMALAAYNCGFSYVRVAIRNTKADPISWEAFRAALSVAKVGRKVPKAWRVNDYVMQIVPPGYALSSASPSVVLPPGSSSGHDT